MHYKHKGLRFAGVSASAAVFMAISGCSTLDPQALQSVEVVQTVQMDKARLTEGVEPLSGALRLEEAIARAIKYNTDGRLKAMEEAVAYGTFDAGRYDMLPRLVAAAGYRYRNNDLISRSEDSVTGQPSLANPYISSSREAATADLGFSWSLLDFGQSYFAAKQNADRVLVAGERRRKAVHTLVQDVRTAYWRVVAAQTLGDSLGVAIREAEAVLADANQAEKEQLRSPIEPLRYQRQLLENLRLLEVIEHELSTARIELSSLARLPLTQSFRVVEPAVAISTSWLEVPVEQMEEQALLSNPDLRESMYNTRIAQQETRRILLRLFPGLSFNYAMKHSNDRFLINQSWNDASAQLSFNLLGLLAMPAQLRLADAGVALADQKRMTTQMAVLTQLHIARQQYANAAQQFERADAIAGVDGRILTHVTNQERVEKQTRLERVSQRTAAILSSLRRYQALSNAQAAASRLQATLGLELAVAGNDQMSLPELTGMVAESLKVWESGRLPPPADKLPGEG